MYAKIRKKTNTIENFVEMPEDDFFYFYVEMYKIEKNGPLDDITFILKTPLTELEKGYFEEEGKGKAKKKVLKVISPLIKDISDGVISHTYTKSECEDIEALKHNLSIDKTTRELIKRWCLVQPEGCEEAFFCMEKDNPRFIEYMNKKQEIIQDRKKHKKQLKTNITLENIKNYISL